MGLKAPPRYTTPAAGRHDSRVADEDKGADWRVKKALFCGISAAGPAGRLLQLAQNSTTPMIVLSCDRGDRYLSTGVFPARACFPASRAAQPWNFTKNSTHAGLTLSLPIFRGQEGLSDMHSGEVLKVLATDPGSLRFVAFSARTGNDLLDQQNSAGRRARRVRALCAAVEGWVPGAVRLASRRRSEGPAAQMAEGRCRGNAAAGALQKALLIR